MTADLVARLEARAELLCGPDAGETVALLREAATALSEHGGGGEVEYEFEVWQDDAMMASVCCTDYATAKGEADHYALMYGQDGPVEVRMYEKRRITTPPPAPAAAHAAEVEALKESLDGKRHEANAAWVAAEAAERDASAKQARIDALMLEYCPDEMTPEQVADWAQHQAVAATEQAGERENGTEV